MFLMPVYVQSLAVVRLLHAPALCSYLLVTLTHVQGQLGTWETLETQNVELPPKVRGLLSTACDEGNKQYTSTD